MSKQQQAVCIYSDEAGWLTDEQRPCPKAHCALRSGCASHVDVATGEHTCPACLGKIRRDLQKILSDRALMLDEATHAGLDSEAVNLAGPSANLVRIKWRMINADRAGHNVDDLDRLDPYTCLADHEHAIRDLLDHNGETLVSETLSSVITYLDWVLTDMARSDDCVQLIDELSKDASRLRSHLEAVLHDSRAPERGAPCPTCSDENGKGPRLVKRYVDVDETGASDRWSCPADPQHWFSEADYRQRIGVTYLQHAECLPLKDLTSRTGVPMRQLRLWTAPVRRWANGELIEHPPRLRPTTRVRGRKAYRIADVERLMTGG